MKKFLPSSSFSFLYAIFQKSEKSKLISLIFSILIGQGLYMLLPMILGLLIDHIFVRREWAVSWLFIFPAAWLLSTILLSIAKFFTSSITQDVRKISKQLIFCHIINMPNPIFLTRGAGEFENLMSELSLNSRYLANESLSFFIRIFVSIAVSLLTIWYTSIDLAFVFFVWVSAYIPISYLSAKKSIRHVEKSLESSAEVSATTVDVIQNHELIPAFGTEKFEIDRFDQLLTKERNAYLAAQKTIDTAELMQRLLQAVLPLSIVMALTYSGAYIKMTPGEITGLLVVALMVTAQVGDFGRGILAFFEMKERMQAALKKIACASQELDNHNPIEPETWDIGFSNVNFAYGENGSGIHQLLLKIPTNEKIGIIGYSGAGKTTLIKLLRGYLRPQRGKITIGGIDINKIDPQILTKNIAEVSQSIPIFHRSIRENVAYGCKDVGDEQIWQILELAQLFDCVKQLPHGLDTVVGVRGQKMSGGERARLGIARAFIRNAKIIILDEATAALDSESEMLIQKGIENLKKGRTLIVIAHRLSTLRKMDRIIILDKGRIVSDGTHHELLSRNELYARFWNMQLADHCINHS